MTCDFFRKSCCDNSFPFSLPGSENVLVFGGRSSTQFAMGDCYLLHIKSRTWRKVFTRDINSL